MDEIQEYYNKARTKFKHSKVLYEIEGYADSVSLSYYSMLLIAKALLLKKGIAPKTHKGLIHVFSEEYVNKGEYTELIVKNIGIHLWSLPLTHACDNRLHLDDIFLIFLV